MKSDLLAALQFIAKKTDRSDNIADVTSVVNSLPDSILVAMIQRQFNDKDRSLLKERDVNFFDSFTIPGFEFTSKDMKKLTPENQTEIFDLMDNIAKHFPDTPEKSEKPTKRGETSGLEDILGSIGDLADDLKGIQESDLDPMNLLNMMQGQMLSSKGSASAGGIGSILEGIQKMGNDNQIIQDGIQWFMKNQANLENIRMDLIRNIRRIMKKYGVTREKFWKFVKEVLSVVPLVREYTHLIHKDELINVIFGPKFAAPMSDAEKRKLKILKRLKKNKFDI